MGMRTGCTAPLQKDKCMDIKGAGRHVGEGCTQSLSEKSTHPDKEVLTPLVIMQPMDSHARLVMTHILRV